MTTTGSGAPPTITILVAEDNPVNQKLTQTQLNAFSASRLTW